MSGVTRQTVFKDADEGKAVVDEHGSFLVDLFITDSVHEEFTTLKSFLSFVEMVNTVAEYLKERSNELEGKRYHVLFLTEDSRWVRLVQLPGGSAGVFDTLDTAIRKAEVRDLRVWKVVSTPIGSAMNPVCYHTVEVVRGMADSIAPVYTLSPQSGAMPRGNDTVWHDLDMAVGYLKQHHATDPFHIMQGPSGAEIDRRATVYTHNC